MILHIILFILGLILLIKGGDWFVDGSSKFAKRFHVPEIIIGATVVAIGTTLPELMVSATSASSGHGEMAYGNAIGSIICNVSLVAAITIAIRPPNVNKKAFYLPSLTFGVSILLYAIISYFVGYFSRTIGIILLSIFLLYILLTVYIEKKNMDKKEEKRGKEYKFNFKKIYIDFILLIVGGGLIAIGAKLLVDNGIEIALDLGLSEKVIALTFIALGTSLPELVTAITALIKKHSALSLGNIIGANILNLVLVCGLSITISPFAIPVNNSFFGHNSTLFLELPLVILTMSLLLIPILLKNKLYKWQGYILLILYISFISLQFILI